MNRPGRPVSAGFKSRSGPAVMVVTVALFATVTSCRDTAPIDPRFAVLDARFRGHRELTIAGDSRWEPLVLFASTPAGLCVTVPPVVDTSLWQARWAIDNGGGDSEAAPWLPPVKRLESTLCFESPLPAGLAPGSHRLCPELLDTFDGVAVRLACLPFQMAENSETYETAKSGLDSTYSAKSSIAPDIYLERLDDTARDALAAGFPLLSMRARLMAVHALRGRGTPDDWKRVDVILGDRPAFLDSPGALSMAGEFDMARAIAFCDRNTGLKTAWLALNDAESAFQRAASDSWPVPRVRQADLIASAGSPGEARARMAELAGACDAFGCEPRMENTVHGTHAWHTLLDLDASDAELDCAEHELADAIASTQPKEDALVIANRWVNLAFAQARRSEDARPALERVRQLLAHEDTAGSGRAGLYAAWARIIAGLDALRRSDTIEALTSCEAVARAADWPQLAAQSHSCRARAFAHDNDLAAARREIDRALAIHAELSAASIGQAISLGPGQRAADFYLAAGLAIDDGDPQAAWQVLVDLDTLTALEAVHARCEPGTGEDSERERAHLSAALVALVAPAPLDRMAQREHAAMTLRTRLQELLRLQGACAATPALSSASTSDPGFVDARVFPLDDAVVSLWRRPVDGAVRVQRAELQRNERIRRLEALDSSSSSSPGTAEWDELAKPFVTALVPDDREPGIPVRISLYGSMQRVPLAALPVGDASGTRWGAQSTIIVVPARVALELLPETPESPGTTASPTPLFIVDPRQNLTAGRALASTYRRLFPGAIVLEGASASRDAVRAALSSANAPGSRTPWIHFDGHGHFDPAFGELSSLQLSDGEILADEFARASKVRELVNLSGCQTGRSPVTADAGQFGAARALLAGGVQWVVASRTNLPDAVALAFNTTFYQALHASGDPAGAYREAISSISRSHTPADWSGLLLLGHPANSISLSPGGQSEQGSDSLDGGRKLTQ